MTTKRKIGLSMLFTPLIALAIIDLKSALSLAAILAGCAWIVFAIGFVIDVDD